MLGERLVIRATCQAPWGCSRVSSKVAGTGARHIAGLSLCRSCYQYVYEQARNSGILPSGWPKLMRRLSGPTHEAPVIAMKCAGPGCGDIIPKGATDDKRRFIGRTRENPGISLCRKCYQRAWEYANDHPGKSLEDAWRQMPPRRRVAR